MDILYTFAHYVYSMNLRTLQFSTHSRNPQPNNNFINSFNQISPMWSDRSNVKNHTRKSILYIVAASLTNDDER